MSTDETKGGHAPAAAGSQERSELGFNRPLKKPPFWVGVLVMVAAGWRAIFHDVHWVDIAIQFIVTAAQQKMHL